MHALARLAGLLCVLCSAPLALAAPTIAEEGFAERIAACTSCHGVRGEGGDERSPYHPRLAGQTASYLYEQLRLFQTGARDYPAMNRIVRDLPDEYLRAIASNFSQQSPPKRAAQVDATPALIEQGRRLVTAPPTSGDRKACVQCHGQSLGGSLAEQAPALAGQHQAYLASTLQDWKTGRRPDVKDCGMGAVAAELGDDQIRAVAAYIASLPVAGAPEDAAPLPPAQTDTAQAQAQAGVGDADIDLYHPKNAESEEVAEGEEQPLAAPGEAVPPQDGLPLYAEHCAFCHGDDGQGADAHYPPLAGSPTVLERDPTDLLRMILEGGFAAATAEEPRPYSMPPFGPHLTDVQIAAVASYVRNSWGNEAPAVSPEDVNALR